MTRHLFLADRAPQQQGTHSDLASKAMYCPLISQADIDKAVELADVRGDQVSSVMHYSGTANATIIRVDNRGFDYPIEYAPEMIYGADYETT
ncbi:MAG: hypothetical protein AAGF01_12500 [Cyanobacteria bacterium P01_G01_bin.38]